MSITSHLEYVMSEILFRETDWELESAANVNISATAPPFPVFPFFGVGAVVEGGFLDLKDTSNNEAKRVRYLGVGGTAGLSLLCSPLNLTFALPQMPVRGKLYALPTSGWRLTEDEFEGGMVYLEASIDIKFGGSFGVMFLGCDPVATAMAFSTLTIPGAQPVAATALALSIASAEALVLVAGAIYSVVPFNASVSAYIGLSM
jgi:hypothetical protein